MGCFAIVYRVYSICTDYNGQFTPCLKISTVKGCLTLCTVSKDTDYNGLFYHCVPCLKIPIVMGCFNIMYRV